MNRNAIYDALFALTDSLLIGGQPLADRGRRLQMWDKAPQPSLYQIEPTEVLTATDGQLSKRTLKASWIIYHRAGKDQSATPARTTNDILDALEALFPQDHPGFRQTLGGLVYRTWIDGTVHKDSGDLDGQAMIIVPITILVP